MSSRSIVTALILALNYIDPVASTSAIENEFFPTIDLSRIETSHGFKLKVDSNSVVEWVSDSEMIGLPHTIVQGI